MKKLLLMGSLLCVVTSVSVYALPPDQPERLTEIVNALAQLKTLQEKSAQERARVTEAEIQKAWSDWCPWLSCCSVGGALFLVTGISNLMAVSKCKSTDCAPPEEIRETFVMTMVMWGATYLMYRKWKQSKAYVLEKLKMRKGEEDILHDKLEDTLHDKLRVLLAQHASTRTAEAADDNEAGSAD